MAKVNVSALENNSFMGKRNGPVVLCIMDGVGIGKYEEGDAVRAAKMPHLTELLENNLSTQLKAHGKAVGLASDLDMGNSEVGHNAIGAGRVFDQGSKLVSESINSGRIFEGEAWKDIVENVKGNNSTLHFMGLLSDGNVHSHIDNLAMMVNQAATEGVQKMRFHLLLDGRDTGETSALEYFEPFEAFLEELRQEGYDARIASGGGRMVITMDRYNADWEMVEKGWNTHVRGAERYFKNAVEAIIKLREETGAIDQDLPPFVISDDGQNPIGKVQDKDSVVFFNFRGDRAIEMTRAFTEKNLKEFDRKEVPDVTFAGMMQYDGDLKLPERYLVEPPAIDRTMAEYLVASGVKQFSISETQKFGHITYFFNGNCSGKFDENLETYEEIPSDRVPFETKPEMKCREITNRVLEVIKDKDYKLIKLNFPNGDMVGHTGVFDAAVKSLEAMDTCIGDIAQAVKEEGGILIVSADHGNSDDMYEHNKDGSVVTDENGRKKPKTSHSLNPVPVVIYDPEYQGEYDQNLQEDLGISSLAATTLNLMGYKAPEDYDPSIVKMKEA